MFWHWMLAIFKELSLAYAAYVWNSLLDIPYIKIIVMMIKCYNS
jgi:hypothetical protein